MLPVLSWLVVLHFKPTSLFFWIIFTPGTRPTEHPFSIHLWSTSWSEREYRGPPSGSWPWHHVTNMTPCITLATWNHVWLSVSLSEEICCKELDDTIMEVRWQVPRSSVGKLETQESWWHVFQCEGQQTWDQEAAGVSVQVWRQKKKMFQLKAERQKELPPVQERVGLCSIQILSWLGEACPY